MLYQMTTMMMTRLSINLMPQETAIASPRAILSMTQLLRIMPQKSRLLIHWQRHCSRSLELPHLAPNLPKNQSTRVKWEDSRQCSQSLSVRTRVDSAILRSLSQQWPHFLATDLGEKAQHWRKTKPGSKRLLISLLSMLVLLLSLASQQASSAWSRSVRRTKFLLKNHR